MPKSKYTKRSDGRYSTSISTGKFDENGKPIRKTLYASSSAALEKKVSAMQTDVNRGTYSDDKGKTLFIYAREWFKATKENSVEKSTARDYLNVINNHFDLIEDKRLKDLTKTDILLQVNKVDNSRETKRRIIITIKQILEAAIDDGLLYRNVARSVKAPVPAKGNRRPLTEAEKNAIKRCEFTPMEKLFIDILFCCGLRRGEILALQIGDIDFKKYGIHVSHSVSHVGGTNIKPPKSPSSIRFVEAPAWLIDELKEYRRNLDSLFLFYGQNGQIMGDATFKRFWRRIYDKINASMGGNDLLKMTDITPHIFRHNYATMLYYSGIDLKEAQRLLGHSDIKLTLEIYTHLIENSKSTTEKINSIAL